MCSTKCAPAISRINSTDSEKKSKTFFFFLLYLEIALLWQLAAALGMTEEELAAKVRAHDAARDAFHRPRSAVHSAEEIDTVVALAAANHARRDAYVVLRNFVTGWLPWGLGPSPLARPLRRDAVPLNPARVVDDLFLVLC